MLWIKQWIDLNLYDFQLSKYRDTSSRLICNYFRTVARILTDLPPLVRLETVYNNIINDIVMRVVFRYINT